MNRKVSHKASDLVDCALALFAAHGYHAVGVDRIRDASGVAKMTLYKHFASKEVLIERVLERRDERMRASLVLAVEAQVEPMARLRAVFDWHAQWFSQPDFHGCMFIKAAEEFPDDDCAIREVSRRHKIWLRDYLERLLRALRVQQAAEWSLHLLLTLDGLIVHANLFRSGGEVVLVAWQRIEAELQGLRAPD